MLKKILTFILSFIFLITSLFTNLTYAATVATTVMPTVPVNGSESTRMTIGLGYFETWRNSSMQWDNGVLRSQNL